MGVSISSYPRRISVENNHNNITSSTVSVPLEINSGINEIVSDIEDNRSELTLFKSNPVNAAAGDAYWINRFEHLQIQHQNIDKILQSEYEKSVESTNKLFANPNSNISEPTSQMISELQELQDKVSKCYKDNPNQTLVCSNAVRAFDACVKASRNLLEEGSLKKTK